MKANVWGLVHHGTPVAKPWLVTLAQEAELLKHVQPVYEAPQVYLLIPDSHRIGARFEQIHCALRNAVGLLLAGHVNFGVLNEENLQEIPSSAKVIFWVLPYCPTDEVFDTLLRWVRQGGVLYLSGNIGFDRMRQPTRAERFRLLALPEQPVVSPFEVKEEVWQMPPIVREVGQGKVLYVPYPLELRAQASHRTIYTQALHLAGVKGIGVAVQDGDVHALAVPTRDGGRVYALVRTDTADKPCRVSIPTHGVALVLQPRGSAFVLVNGQGEVVTVESEGDLLLNGQKVATAGGHYALVSLDGRGLLSSKRILVLPHQQREVTVNLPSQGRLATHHHQSSVLVFTPGETSIIADRLQH